MVNLTTNSEFMEKGAYKTTSQIFYLNFFGKNPNLFDGRNSTKSQSNDGDSLPDEDRLVYPTYLPRTRHKIRVPQSVIENREIRDRIIEDEGEM